MPSSASSPGWAPAESGGSTTTSTSTTSTTSSTTTTTSTSTTSTSTTSTSTTSTSTTSSGTGGAGGASCNAPGTASCENSVLTVCDGTGHAAAGVTCPLGTVCDPLVQQCTDVGRLSLGIERGCAVEGDESIWCWGVNYGEPDNLGQASLVLDDSHYMIPSPTKMGPIAGQPITGRQVAVANYYQCFVHDDGTVGCWGVQDNDNLGASCPSGPSCLVDPVPGLTSVVEIAVAPSDCACARLQSGEVDCWGERDGGCMGDAGATQGPQTPVKVPLDGPAVQIAVGDGFLAPVCARLLSGRVSCWGYTLPPTDLGITGAEDITVSRDLVVIRTGAGATTMGAPLGAGLFWTTLVPPSPDAGTPDGGPGVSTLLPIATPFPGFGTVEHMAAAWSLCASQTDGTVQCVDNSSGPGDPPSPPSPVLGIPQGAIAELRVGNGNVYGACIHCLRLAGTALAGNVFCWGDDGFGALGFGGPEYLRAKVDVPSFSTLPVTSLTNGSTSVNAVLGDHSAWYWGQSPAMQSPYWGTLTPFAVLNLAANNAAVRTDDYDGEGYALKVGPAPVSLFDNATAEPGSQRLQTFSSTNYVDARRGYVDFGLLPPGAPTLGQVVAFSANDEDGNANQCGLFGDGTQTKRAAAQAVPGLSAVALAYQDFGDCSSHVCVIVPSGAVQCWGSNNTGESGDPGNPPMLPPLPPVFQPTTVTIPGVTKPIVSIAVGSKFTCATDGPSGTGQVYCWGANDFGQLGNDFAFTYASAQPMAVVNIDNGTGTSPAVGVTAFDSFACAWLADKTVWCWGRNDFGQLGNGNLDVQTLPVQVTGLTDAALVTAGPDFACALNTAGTVVSCWGSTYFGQAGTGKNGYYPTPMAVTNLL